MGAMALDAIFAPGLDGELAARLLELTSDVAAAVDRDGVVVQANPALVRAAGRDPAGLPSEVLVHPEDRLRGRGGGRGGVGCGRARPSAACSTASRASSSSYGSARARPAGAGSS